MAKRIILLIILLVIGDIYFYQAVSTLTVVPGMAFLYWAIDLGLIFALSSIALVPAFRARAKDYLPWLISALMLSLIPKLLASPILLGEDIVRLLTGFAYRNIYVSEAALLIAVGTFLIMIFGLTRGKYHYKVRRETLYFPNLPTAFDGFTITQLSDIHSGSLKNKRRVQQGVDLANAQESDLILFTGDLVNNTAEEMKPWSSTFGELRASYGKYSVLGNHDYGDYVRWESQQAKSYNLQQLEEVHHEIGFQLLRNRSMNIHKGNASISLVGVENWGKGGFQQYGDLNRATENVDKAAFKILMSHDPSHWKEQVIDHPQDVQLTLSGHTHGMQFGLDLPFLRWSPIQYFYKQWAGLYQQDGKYLYVNRGFGFHGLQGRIGIWPEITVLTLKKAKVSTSV